MYHLIKSLKNGTNDNALILLVAEWALITERKRSIERENAQICCEIFNPEEHKGLVLLVRVYNTINTLQVTS